MTEFESDDEILEFAIAREVQANHFYLALVEHVKSPQIRDILESLAKEELEHKARLELELMKQGRVVTATQDTTGSADDYIIGDTEGGLDIDYKDVILLSLEKENAAFRTYVDLAATVKDNNSRETLLSLAEEEVRHKLRWENAYEALIKG